MSGRHSQLTVRGDKELDTLIKGTIVGGGVILHIHKSLINKTTKECGRATPHVVASASLQSI